MTAASRAAGTDPLVIGMPSLWNIGSQDFDDFARNGRSTTQRGFAKNRMNLSLVCNHSLGFQHPSKVNNLRAGDEKIVWRITHIPRKRSK